ncbi:MAG: shikimate kinase / 3-dehydroquinate synthase [Thermoleophilaceae bacterium]|nr:shikimate kinase / 3-dehydroquinate synthase [Thermoleophilaceae bacterium]
MEALTNTPAGSGRAGAPGGALVFVGFMGAGKSSAARAVAARLGIKPLDSDRELEAELGHTLETFFDSRGEDEFRRREEEVVLRLLGRPDASVVALGGGVLGSDAVRQALREHTVVHLDVDLEEAWKRASGTGRPLARDRARFESLHAERRAVYEAAAVALLPSGGRELAERALTALQALRADRGTGHPTRLLWGDSASGGYPVFVGRGLIARDLVHPQGRERFVVTDQNVASHYTLEGRANIVIPAGETEKTMGRAEQVLRELAGAGAGKDDLVVALGGGVVGDLAGFCAATYQRGIAYTQVPTTLVAQVDSAFGGKTGVDLPEGKNYAGAYHLPAGVSVDAAALETLPPEEVAAGYAEVVKTALIAGGELWERVGSAADPDEEIIFGCIRTKLGVVAEDERDGGRRQVLNLGHTVGHAIEAATGYSRYRHGEAVSIGLMAALRLSGLNDLREQVGGLLSSHGLPVIFDGASVDDVVALVARDKKRSGGRVPFVLVESPGNVTYGHEVSDGDLRAAIQEVSNG